MHVYHIINRYTIRTYDTCCYKRNIYATCIYHVEKSI